MVITPLLVEQAVLEGVEQAEQKVHQIRQELPEQPTPEVAVGAEVLEHPEQNKQAAQVAPAS